MLSQSDFPIAEALKLLTNSNLDVALIVPTPTGMQKSIMDATEDVRSYLSERGYHDYMTQGQGEEAKVVRDAFFVDATQLVPTRVSLYRPQTKHGDPRIWLGRATREQVQPYNLLAILIADGVLYVVNMSDPAVRRSLSTEGTPLWNIAQKFKKARSAVAEELLERLRAIASQGFVSSLRSGDTGVGFTLETHLGIEANPNQTPDYQGIEIKTKRSRAQSNRTTLFSQVPDWELSPVGSAMALLHLRGYTSEGRLQLYHTLNAQRPNSIGLMLHIDEDQDWLKQVHVSPLTHKITHDTTWQMDTLRHRLLEKHRETFWVHARSRGRGPSEEFHYYAVDHTRSPKVRNLEALIEDGVITMDYTLSLKTNTRVRDHGYLFKIRPDNLDALFPPPERYILT